MRKLSPQTLFRLVPGLAVLVVLAGAPPIAPADAESPAEAMQPSAPTAPGVPSAPRVWLGPDKEPLPFQTHEAAVEFLTTAQVLDREQIPVGVTRSHRVLLHRNGVRARATFKNVHDVRERVRLADGTFVMYFRDTYLNEVAAYELSRLLGMDLVPPTVIRELRGQEGALMLWIEDATMEVDRRDRGLEVPDEALWRRKLADMTIFDSLINNIDRNLGDILYDPDWNVWLIDHSRAFGRDRVLSRPERISRCSTTLFEGLKALDRQTATERLSPYLPRFEIRGLMARRDAILDILEERIATHGAERVLFSYAEPARPVRVETDEPAEAPPPP